MEKENSKKIIIEQLSENLEALETYSKEIWQFFPLPICHINPFQIILDVNLALEEFFGWKALELIGEKVEIFFSDKALAKKIYQEILKTEKTIKEEVGVITKDKEEKMVSVSARARLDKDGNIIGCYLAFTDISELKKFQKELEKKVEERTRELKEKIKELENFNKLAIGRELKMIELKEEIARLKKELAKKEENSEN